MGAKKRRSYTKAERSAVLADVRAVGVSEAARKHAVPQTTVSNWIVRGRRRGATAPSEPSATPPVSATPGERPATTTKETLQSRVAKTYTPSQSASPNKESNYA